jgi:hypothetical protein
LYKVNTIIVDTNADVHFLAEIQREVLPEIDTYLALSEYGKSFLNYISMGREALKVISVIPLLENTAIIILLLEDVIDV